MSSLMFVWLVYIWKPCQSLSIQNKTPWQFNQMLPNWQANKKTKDMLVDLESLNYSKKIKKWNKNETYCLSIVDIVWFYLGPSYFYSNQVSFQYCWSKPIWRWIEYPYKVQKNCFVFSRSGVMILELILKRFNVNIVYCLGYRLDWGHYCETRRTSSA